MFRGGGISQSILESCARGLGLGFGVRGACKHDEHYHRNPTKGHLDFEFTKARTLNRVLLNPI